MGNIFPSYNVASANQYIVKTGFNIDNVKIAKSSFKLPFQKTVHIDANSQLYEFSLSSFTIDKFDFVMNCIFMIGPDVMTGDVDLDKGNLTKYVIQLYPHNVSDKRIHRILENIAESILSNISTKISMGGLMDNFSDFKLNFINIFQKEIEQYGLKIFNANIKKIQDIKGNNYLTDMLSDEKLKIIESNAILERAKVHAEKTIEFEKVSKDILIDSMKTENKTESVGNFIKTVNKSFENDNKSTLEFIHGNKNTFVECSLPKLMIIQQLLEPVIKQIKESTGIDTKYTYTASVPEKN